MSSPLISIIIPALNEESVLQSALAGASGVEDAERILADGGSADATVEIAQSNGCRVVNSQSGRARQMNAGAAVAQGELLLFLHADCILPAEAALELQAAARDPCVDYGAFRHRINAPGLACRVIESSDNLRARGLRMPYGDQAIFVRRRLFEEVGGFPQRTILEEVYLMRRFRRERRRFRLLRSVVLSSSRRWERRGVLRTTLTNWSILLADLAGVSDERLSIWYRGGDPQSRSAAELPPRS